MIARYPVVFRIPMDAGVVKALWVLCFAAFLIVLILFFLRTCPRSSVAWPGHHSPTVETVG